MEREQEIQRRFTRIIRNEERPHATSPRLQVYRELVRFRFEEVLSNTFPIFKKQIDPEQWNDLVEGFVREGAASPYIWQMPGEFRKYAAKQVEEPWAKDLLWFEWIEVEIFMEPPEKPKKGFQWRKRFRLAPTARCKVLEYKVYDPGFFDDPALQGRGKFPLLLYLDPESFQVLYLEITPFMRFLLKKMERQLPAKALGSACKKFGLKPKEAKPLAREALERFTALGIIR